MQRTNRAGSPGFIARLLRGGESKKSEEKSHLSPPLRLPPSLRLFSIFTTQEIVLIIVDNCAALWKPFHSWEGGSI